MLVRRLYKTLNCSFAKRNCYILCLDLVIIEKHYINIKKTYNDSLLQLSEEIGCNCTMTTYGSIIQLLTI